MPREHFEPARESDLLSSLNQAMSTALGCLSYIGPLREPARLLYPTSDQLESDQIAPNGAGTVAVLERNARQDSLVEIPSPLRSTASSDSACSLEYVVGAWAKYLGIAETIQVVHVQHYGLRLIVRAGKAVDSAEADAPNVGVGLTQLLPILVAGCIVSHGGVLIIEQPELHLHPAVQTRLAEFLVAIVRAGTQVIVETHSEHLINGIRLAIARGEIEASMLSLLFCERYGDTTEVTRIQLDGTGLIQRWPRGFFDENDKTTFEIVSRSLRSGSDRD